MARITAIIAHRNYNEYLQDAINSCLNQTIPIKYVVIDDLSDVKPEPPTNATKTEKEYYTLFETEFCKYLYLRKNYKQAMARNFGIYESWNDSDYFLVQDADDISLPNKCEELLKEMYNDVGVVYGDYYILDVDTGLMKMEYKYPYNFNVLQRECIVHSNALISKEALACTAENGFFFDPNLTPIEDYELWIRISEKMNIRHVPKFLSIVRNHKNNSTYSTTEERRIKCLNILHQKRLQRQQNRN